MAILLLGENFQSFFRVEEKYLTANNFKEINQMKKGLKNITLVVIIVILIGVAVYLTLNKSIFKTAEMKCRDLGGTWGQCFISGPCCAINFSDAAGKCTKGNDCQAKICEISRDSNPDINGNYTGFCPGNYTGNPSSDFFKPHCGTAQIENGKITLDRRNENCMIY